MRISDWSSDVCSSDLSGNRSAARAGKLGAAKSQRQESWAASGCSPRSRDVCQANGAGAPDYGCARRDRLQHAERQQMPQGLRRVVSETCRRFSERLQAGDRKGVVLGKSWSERVDLGGRRNIKIKILRY